MEILICEKCGAEFEANNRGKIYCTRKCKMAAKGQRYRAARKNGQHPHEDSRGKTKRRGYLKRAKLLADRGGKCSSCGYDKNSAAMQFHHLDPSTKRFNIDSSACRIYSYETLKTEAEKCIILCANCHSELHSTCGEHWKTYALMVEVNYTKGLQLPILL